MSNTLEVVCYEPTQGHALLSKTVWPFVKNHLMAGRRMIISVKPEKRSSAQNRRLWSMLSDISGQVDWYGRKLSAEEWKHVFTASLKKQDVVPGIDGGFVVLGLSTSKMTVAEMSDLQTLMEAFGADKDVRFTGVQEE